MYDANDTIAALSTPPGSGSRGVVRLSGPEAFHIALSMADRGAPSSAWGAFRAVISAGQDIRVQGALYLMKAPRSYTREDVAEIHVPGSPAICSAVLRNCLLSGARAADPGEFTFRAFMNGRMDLSQAEAVDRIIRASDASARRSAALDVGGRLAARVRETSAAVCRALALVEAGLDFSDQALDPAPREEIRALLESTAARAREISMDSGGPAPACEPVFLLAGMANSGKSTLLNALAGKAVSITSAAPGTTRDVVTFSLNLGGRQFTVADPAGFCGESGAVGDMAQGMFERWLTSADAVVAVFDCTAALEPARELLSKICAGRPCLAVLNKTDLARDCGDLKPLNFTSIEHRVSALTGAGVAELAKAMATMASGGLGPGPCGFGLSERQRAAMAAAAGCCERAVSALDAWADEICALEAREAIESLGLMSGRGLSEEVLAAIFSGFCVGK